MPPKERKIADERFTAVKEISETAPPTEGVRGSFKVSDVNFGMLDSQEVVRNINDRETAEQFGRDFTQATKMHEDRSPRSQRADESRSAPLTTDFGTWADDPAHWDFPGVDSKRDSFDAEFGDEGLW